MLHHTYAHSHAFPILSTRRATRTAACFRCACPPAVHAPPQCMPPCSALSPAMHAPLLQCMSPLLRLACSPCWGLHACPGQCASSLVRANSRARPAHFALRLCPTQPTARLLQPAHLRHPPYPMHPRLSASDASTTMHNMFPPAPLPSTPILTHMRTCTHLVLQEHAPDSIYRQCAGSCRRRAWGRLLAPRSHRHSWRPHPCWYGCPVCVQRLAQLRAWRLPFVRSMQPMRECAELPPRSLSSLPPTCTRTRTRTRACPQHCTRCAAALQCMACVQMEQPTTRGLAVRAATSGRTPPHYLPLPPPPPALPTPLPTHSSRSTITSSSSSSTHAAPPPALQGLARPCPAQAQPLLVQAAPLLSPTARNCRIAVRHIARIAPAGTGSQVGRFVWARRRRLHCSMMGASVQPSALPCLWPSLLCELCALAVPAHPAMPVALLAV